MEGLSYQQIKDLQQLIAPPKDDSDSDLEEDDLKQRLSRQKIGYLFHSIIIIKQSCLSFLAVRLC